MKKFISIIIICAILSGCMTNRKSYFVQDHNFYEDRFYTESQSEEETNFAGYIIAIGSAAALIIAAGLEGKTR